MICSGLRKRAVTILYRCFSCVRGIIQPAARIMPFITSLLGARLLALSLTLLVLCTVFPLIHVKLVLDAEEVQSRKSFCSPRSSSKEAGRSRTLERLSLQLLHVDCPSCLGHMLASLI